MTLGIVLLPLFAHMARAEDPAILDSSHFHRKALAASELATLALERKALKEREDAQPKEKTPEQKQAEQDAARRARTEAVNKKLKETPSLLTEIGGDPAHPYAIFLLPDGEILPFVQGQIVPNFGTLVEVTPQAVRDDHGHWSEPDGYLVE